jgi:hypothetical protein
MLFKECFTQYKKDDLLDFAKVLQLRGVSSLKKADLIDRLVAELLRPEVMEQRFAAFTDAQIAVFEKALNGPYTTTEEEEADAIWLREFDYVSVVSTDPVVVTVPEDLAAAYQAINTPTFHEQRQRVSWMLQCLGLCQELYGMTPLSVLRSVYETRPGFQATEEQIEELLNLVPEDMSDSVYLTDDSPEEGQRGYSYVVEEQLMEDDGYEALLEEQGGVPYELLPYEELEALSRYGYLPEEPAYEQMRAFLKEGQIKESKIAGLCVELWGMFSYDATTAVALDWLREQPDVANLDQTVLETLLENCRENTCLRRLRGGRLSEQPAPKAPKAVPVRKTQGPAFAGGQVPEMWNVLSPAVRAIAMEEDVQPVRAAKVGRNEPCPCGSGKKYKKCCGR